MASAVNQFDQGINAMWAAHALREAALRIECEGQYLVATALRLSMGGGSVVVYTAGEAASLLTLMALDANPVRVSA